MQHFYNSDLGQLLALDPNQTYAAIPVICAMLEIPHAPQIKRIKAHAILAAGLRQLKVPNLDGEDERQACLRIDLIPLWAAGLDPNSVSPEAAPIVQALSSEMASVLWQSFRPQAFETNDQLLPNRWEQTQAEVAYRGALAVANLTREQMLLERQLSADVEAREMGGMSAEIEANAMLLARTVRRVAQVVGERSRRNEYPAIFDGLYRQWGITTYRRMPQARLNEALAWLERWYGDALGEPEPMPDI